MASSDDVIVQATPRLRACLERALSGEPLDSARAYPLIVTSDADLPALMSAAAILRDRGKGHTATYSRKVFIPLTNLCRDKCGYCTFAKIPSHPEAKTMGPDEVLNVVWAGAAAGCKEALFSLGEKPEERWAAARAHLGHLGYSTTIDYLVTMCRRVCEETPLIPHINCGVLTRDELLALREVSASMGLMLESVSDRLLRPGAAHFGCVGKVPAIRLETLDLAGQLQIPFTTGILIGIGETPQERLDALWAIRELHQRYGHIQEVIIQNFRAKPDTRMADWPEPVLADMLRTIAVARLILGPAMNLQAPPNLMPEDHQMYLGAGINDWGGVSPVTLDHINPERAWPAIADLRRVTEAADFRLRERLCVYPEYVRRAGCFPTRLQRRVDAYIDETGLVREELTRAN